MHSYLWQCCGNNVLAPAIIPRATRFLSDTHVAVIILFVLCAQSMLSLTRLYCIGIRAMWKSYCS
jgi:hypothetical protein